MSGKGPEEAKRLFEEYVLKNPAVNKDAGGNRGRKDRKDKNPGDPNTYTADLHGKRLEEAVAEADLAIGKLGKDGYTKIRMITGTGRHSPGVYSPLYEGLEDHLRGKAGLAFTKKDGVFTIWRK